MEFKLKDFSLFINRQIDRANQVLKTELHFLPGLILQKKSRH